MIRKKTAMEIIIIYSWLLSSVSTIAWKSMLGETVEYGCELCIEFILWKLYGSNESFGSIWKHETVLKNI